MYMILLSQTRDISARVQYLVQQSLGNLIELHVLGKYQTIKPCNHAACKASTFVTTHMIPILQKILVIGGNGFIGAIPDTSHAGPSHARVILQVPRYVELH